MKSLLIAGCALAAISAFDPAIAGEPSPTDLGSVAAPHFGTWGFDRTGQDLSVAPGANFFRYANGQWEAETQIPADQTSFGNFDKLELLSENRTRLIVEAAAAGQLRDPDATRITAVYRAFMDEARIQALDAQPLAADLAAIRAERTRRDVAAQMGAAQAGFQAALFGLYIDADRKTPTRYSVYLNTDGLGLPDRDYYLEPQFAEKKAAYEAYVAKMLGQIGWPGANTQARAVVAFETEIAQITWSAAEQRQVEKSYHPMGVTELAAFAPGFDFKAFLGGADLGGRDQVIVSSDTAFPKLAAIFDRTSIDTLKAWQAFHLSDNAAPYLSERFVSAAFAFHGKTLEGQPENRARWKRGIDLVDKAVGEAVGRLYVAQYFTPQAKSQMDALVGGLKDALHDRIEHVTWMEPATKAKALDKLSKFTVKIGYPGRWRDYSALTLTADDLYGDAERAASFDWMRQVRRLDDPVDKLEWGMTPQTVNAYYNASNNEIVFPAAILQPPFFDPTADPAVNYGAIGVVIGHEMTHGFDDQGRKSDGDGVLIDWWTANDDIKFKDQAIRLGAQYSSFEPIPGAHIKGDLTMGENIADLGGLLVALDAYHASLHGQVAPVIDGVTGDQRFFLGFAQAFRSKIRDDALREELTRDEHAPDHYRAIGAVRNVDAWYSAFDIKPTAPNYVAPDQRVRIW